MQLGAALAGSPRWNKIEPRAAQRCGEPCQVVSARRIQLKSWIRRDPYLTVGMPCLLQPGSVHARRDAAEAWRAERQQLRNTHATALGTPPEHPAPDDSWRGLIDQHSLKPQRDDDYGVAIPTYDEAPLTRRRLQPRAGSPGRTRSNRAATLIQARHRGRHARQEAPQGGLSPAERAVRNAEQRGFRDEEARARGEERSSDYVAYLRASVNEPAPSIEAFKFVFDERKAAELLQERALREAAASKKPEPPRELPPPPGLTPFETRLWSAFCAADVDRSMG